MITVYPQERYGIHHEVYQENNTSKRESKGSCKYKSMTPWPRTCLRLYFPPCSLIEQLLLLRFSAPLLLTALKQ